MKAEEKLSFFVILPIGIVGIGLLLFFLSRPKNYSEIQATVMPPTNSSSALDIGEPPEKPRTNSSPKAITGAAVEKPPIDKSVPFEPDPMVFAEGLDSLSVSGRRGISLDEHESEKRELVDSFISVLENLEIALTKEKAGAIITFSCFPWFDADGKLDTDAAKKHMTRMTQIPASTIRDWEIAVNAKNNVKMSRLDLIVWLAGVDHVFSDDSFDIAVSNKLIQRLPSVPETAANELSEVVRGMKVYDAYLAIIQKDACFDTREFDKDVFSDWIELLRK